MLNFVILLLGLHKLIHLINTIRENESSVIGREDDHASYFNAGPQITLLASLNHAIPSSSHILKSQPP